MRATWKGFLTIALVSIPIKVFPATESSEGISFNQLHGSCASRLQQKKWCPTCAREVPSAEIVKGYEFEKGRYVIVTDDELEAMQPASTRTIDVVQFAAADALDPMYVNRTYHVHPDGVQATIDAATIHAGMVGRLAIGKLGIYGREYLVALRAVRNAFVLHTLHHAGELRQLTGPELPAPIASHRMLARRVVDAMTAPLNLADYRDEYRAGVQQLIAAKIDGKDIVAPAAETPRVLELRDALERSLTAATRARKKPAAAGKRKRATAA